MSDNGFSLDDLERGLTRFQFRSSRKHRFRIYRKLEGMLRMNEALSRSLDRLYLNASEMGKYPRRPAAVALREWFLKDRAGVTLSEAMEGWVPTGELYMIRAGEESGTMSKALGTIQSVGEKAKQMKEAVFYAVGYPIFMLILVSFVLWTFGVNLIENMRKSAPKNVVAAMGGVANLSDFINDWGLTLIVGVVLICILIAFTLPRWTGSVRAKFDMFPPWSWFRILQGSGFLLGLSALLGAQVPLKRALEILEEQGNPWMRERINAARQEVLRGRNLGEALRIGKFNFPDPQVAIDLEILSERADVGTVIEQVTEEWINDQILTLKAQAVVARNVGLAVVGGVIAWTMMSIFSVVGELSKGGTNMQSF
ncbi:MAG TPA: type II secretion system F family protein [Alphaproteobacteria bacterium]|nr:type II secretion system F family protein [Alphaproteobacteria bacterium]